MLRPTSMRVVALLLCSVLLYGCWWTKGPTKVVTTTVATPQLRCGETSVATADVAGLNAGSAAVKFTPNGPITAAPGSVASTPDVNDQQKGSATTMVTAGKVDETTTATLSAEVANSGWDAVKANVTVLPCKAGAGWTGGTWTPAPDGTAPSGTYVVEVTPAVTTNGGPWVYEITASKPPGIRSVNIESSRDLKTTDFKYDGIGLHPTPTGQTVSKIWFATFACTDKAKITINNNSYRAGGTLKLTVHLCPTDDGGTALSRTLDVTGPK